MKHSILHVVYFHFKKMKEKARVCVLLISNVSSKIANLQSIFAAFLVVLGPFWLYERFDRCKKSLCQPLKQTSVTINIYQNIDTRSAFDSLSQDLAAKVHQKWPLLNQK